MRIAVSFLLTLLPSVLCFLRIENGKFIYNNQTVFLSGVNAPWVNYGTDFGSGAYDKSKDQFEKWFQRIASHGGNAVRVWLLVNGENAPKFDDEGFATGEDTQSLIKDIGEYLDSAAKNNIFVILCLWNGAVKPRQEVLDLFSNDEKLERYIEKVLSPLVSGLKDKKALAAWEVINEVGGSVQQNIHDQNKCFDTQKLVSSGANWAGSNITMKNALKFINRHIDAIKTADQKVLTTSGAWNERSNLDVCDYCFNYYKDECVREAGGKQKGVLDFYQIHTYQWQNKYTEFSPMLKTAAELKLDKVVIIGELSAKCSPNKTAAQCYQWAYNSGYSGILGWAYDRDGDNNIPGVSHSEEGMTGIRDLTNHGLIRIDIN